MKSLDGLTLISDLHFGWKREPGLRVTKASVEAFQAFQLAQFHSELQNVDEHLVILGDLYNAFTVDYSVIWGVVSCLGVWLQKWTGDLLLVQGNHDVAKNTEHMSALELTFKILRTEFEDRVFLIDTPTRIENNNIFIIPHLINQEAFDEALNEYRDPNTVLLTHANYDNHFAVDKDHSLNISAAQARDFKAIYSGHEHTASVRGNVTMIGSPWPCNIQEAEKAPGCGYLEIDWRELPANPEANFIRVTGDAEAEEAGLVIEACDKLRSVSEAFFITNSVKIGSVDMSITAEVEQSLEKFDPVEEFYNLLPAAAGEKIKEIVEGRM